MADVPTPTEGTVELWGATKDSTREEWASELGAAVTSANAEWKNLWLAHQAMLEFRNLALLSPTNESWGDSHEKRYGFVGMYLATINKYCTEYNSGTRQLALRSDTGGLVLTGTDADWLLWEQNGTLIADSPDGTQAWVEPSGFTGLLPGLIILGVVGAGVNIAMTLGAAWACSELCKTIRAKIERTMLEDQRKYEQHEIDNGVPVDEAHRHTEALMSQANQLAKTKGETETGPADIASTVKHVVWGGVILLLVGTAVYIGAPYVREMLLVGAEKRRKRELAAA